MTTDPTMVRSPDGADIACWRSGDGPPLLLVHGITSSHQTMNEIAPHFAKERSVTTYDRRGRGQSTDGTGKYDFDREIEDAVGVVEALGVDEIDLFAHSFGCYIALGAAARLPDRVKHVVAYSPGFGDRYDGDVLERMEALAQTDPDQALDILLRDIIVMPDGDIEAMRASPVWQDRLANIHTVARECRVDKDYRIDAEALAGVKAAVRVVSGATNAANKQAVARQLTDAIAGAELVIMDGEGHAAHHTAPAALARLALDFFDGR